MDISCPRPSDISSRRRRPGMWDAIGAVSTAVGTVVVIVGGIYAYFQVVAARRGRHLTILLSFQEKYHSIPAREFRRRLLKGELGAPDELDPESLADDDFHRFWEPHDQLEVIGVLVERGLLDFDLVLACFHRSPPMVWEAVGPYIRKRRQTASPHEGRNFERLVERYK